MQPSSADQRWVIATHAVLSFASVAAFKVVSSYSALDVGYSATELGVLAASFSIPSLLVAFHAGRWTDRVGGLRVSLTGDLLVLIAAITPLVVPGYFSLLLSAAIVGLGAMLSLIGQQALVAASVPTREQERVYGTMFSASAAGQMVGPLAATLLAAWPGNGGSALSTSMGYIVAIVLAMCCLVTMPFYGRQAWRRHEGVREPPPPALRAIAAVAAVKGSVPIIAFNAVIVAIIDMLAIFLPAWGAERQIAPAVVGALLSLRSAASIAVRFAMLPMIRLAGRRSLLVASGLLTAICLAALPFSSLAVAFALALGLGIALGLTPPVSMAWLSLNMPTPLRGSAVGLRITANRLSQSAVPILATAIGAGVTGMFLASAALVTLTSFLVLHVPFAPRGPTARAPHDTPEQV